jgi:predicted ATPase
MWLRQPEQVEKAARDALQLSQSLSLALWAAWGHIHLGWALTQYGTSSGTGEIETGLQEADQIGAGRLKPLHLMIAADAYARTGQHRESQSRVDLAFSFLEQGYHPYLAADMHRMRADLLLRARTGLGEAAEVDLRRALEIARTQESPSLQLRAARDLARLLAERGERRQAADLLAPIYSWFTEGFDLPDLKEAKVLLDEL